MRLNGVLVRWYLRRTSLVTWPAMFLAVVYVLLKHQPWAWNDATPMVFVLVHSLVLARLIGGTEGYLYSRGFDRDALWLNLMAATATAGAVAIVWLPAAAIVWSPLRSMVQAELLGNAFYPLMRPKDALWPWLWLSGYAVLLSVFHYAWIRRYQPTLGAAGGDLLAIAFVVTSITAYGFYTTIRFVPWLGYTAAAVLGFVSLSALVMSWHLHRQMEVTS